VFLLAAIAVIVFVSAPARAECGVASVYWQGARTANGERFNPDGVSAAHKTLPFGSRVVVRNQRTGKSILVRINDRGPFVAGRIIDLSRGAARQFGMAGLAQVCIDVVSYGGKTVKRRTDYAQHYADLTARAVHGTIRRTAKDFGAFTRDGIHRVQRAGTQIVRILTPQRVRHHRGHRRHHRQTHRHYQPQMRF
jgi:rare lipoprotein A